MIWLNSILCFSSNILSFLLRHKLRNKRMLILVISIPNQIFYRSGTIFVKNNIFLTFCIGSSRKSDLNLILFQKAIIIVLEFIDISLMRNTCFYIVIFRLNYISFLMISSFIYESFILFEKFILI